MGVSSTTNRVSYTGNGATTSFSFPYYFFNQTDLLVYVYDTVAGGVTQKVLNTGYTISGSPNSQGVYATGASVLFGTAPASTVKITILRKPSPVQNYSLSQNGLISSTALVQQLDYLTLLVQHLEDEVSRSARLPDGMAATFDPTLPSTMALASNVNSAIIVNASGTGITLGTAASAATSYPTFASFPVSTSDGFLAIALDTDSLYAYNLATTSWKLLSSPSSVLAVGTIDSQTASTDGAVAAANTIVMQSASATKPGLVNNTTQSFAGNKTFTGTVAASNLSGTNTGDQTITLTGDVTGSGTGSFATTLTAVTNTKLATMAANTVKANVTGSTATPTDVAITSAATASAAMIRDSNANVAVNNALEGFQTVTSAAGTTTLTVSSPYQTQITGSTTQTVALPAANTLTLGQQFCILNRSTGTVTVNGNTGSLVQTMSASTQCIFTVTNIGSAAGAWDTAYSASTGITALTGDVAASGTGSVSATIQANAVTNSKMATMATGTVKGNVSGSTAAPSDVSATSAATASTLSLRDSNANILYNNVNESFSSTATAAGTTTLTAGSSGIQQFTGTTTQNVSLPATNATGMSLGLQFQIFNRSTGVVTVKDSGGSTVQAMAGGSQLVVTAATSASPGTWDTSYTTTSAASSLTALTGDVAASGPGSASATIQANAVTNSKMATMVNNTIKGNVSGSTAAPSDLTATQATGMLNAMVGDSGSGGTKGLAPAPASGDAAAGKFLKADGTWTAPAASLTNPMTTGGDVIYGGASGVPTRLANGSSGQVLTSAGGTSAPTWSALTAPTVSIVTTSSHSGGFSANTTGTYTTPVGVKAIKVTCVGGGAGGGGAAAVGSGSGAGAGGGGGGTVIKWITTPNSTYSYTVGAGGSGGSAGNNNGGAGNNTTFGTTFLTANGGNAGGGSSTAASVNILNGSSSGGGGSGGDVIIPGGPSTNGICYGSTNSQGGIGGGTSFGAPTGGSVTNGTGGAGQGYGAGGNGGCTLNTATAQGGGAGAPGIIIVEEYYQ